MAKNVLADPKQIEYYKKINTLWDLFHSPYSINEQVKTMKNPPKISEILYNKGFNSDPSSFPISNPTDNLWRMVQERAKEKFGTPGTVPQK
jgi:hypothetical protein